MSKQAENKRFKTSNIFFKSTIQIWPNSDLKNVQNNKNNNTEMMYKSKIPLM